jgi:SAM-dependent methyltransferase
MTHFEIQSSNHKNLLSELSEKYGSDKGSTGEIRPHRSGWLYHSYTEVYDLFLSGVRNTVTDILECGIGTNNTDVASSMGINGTPGASLRMWREYFPNANITGIDIDPRIMFEEDRIQTFVVDQTSIESIEKFKAIVDTRFDLILDDGLHDYLPQITLFENMFDRLKDGGTYIIEDCLNSYSRLIDYLEKNNYQYMAIQGEMKSNLKLYDSFVLIKK